jgi:hypothetical protein
MRQHGHAQSGCKRLTLSGRDDPKLLDDSGEVPKPKGVVGGLIPGYEIVYLHEDN